jgi:predicted xylose isomerase-like sugar epimerase
MQFKLKSFKKKAYFFTSEQLSDKEAFKAAVNKIAAPALSVRDLMKALEGYQDVAVAIRQENGPDLWVTGVAADTDFEPLKNERQVVYLTVE